MTITITNSKLLINLTDLLRQCTVEGRKLIVLQAPGGQTRPYKAPEAVTASKKTWRYYIRRYSSTVEAKGDTE